MMRLKKLTKCQKGLTLIELVIVIGLTGVIVGGLTMTIMQVLNMDARTRNDMIAVYQVRQAGKLVSEDVLGAQYVTPGASAALFLTLNWTDWGTNRTHGVVYTLDANTGVLWRKHYVNSALNSTTKVAEHIDSDETSIAPQSPCSFPDCDVYTFTVTADVSGRTETRVYQIKPRPGT